MPHTDPNPYLMGDEWSLEDAASGRPLQDQVELHQDKKSQGTQHVLESGILSLCNRKSAKVQIFFD